jgi:hypothetical protein
MRQNLKRDNEKINGFVYTENKKLFNGKLYTHDALTSVVFRWGPPRKIIIVDRRFLEWSSYEKLSFFGLKRKNLDDFIACWLTASRNHVLGAQPQSLFGS